jgi:hypothetical protein
MKSRFETDDDAVDERGVVRPGRSLKIPLHLMDENTSTVDAVLQREFRDRQYKDQVLCRPGWRTADMLATATHRARDIARNRIEDAYQEYENRIQDEYKNPNAGRGDPKNTGPHELFGSREGQVCMTGGHEPGHLKMINGELVCVADPVHIPERNDAKPTTKPAMSAYATRQEIEPDPGEEEDTEEDVEESQSSGIERRMRFDVPDQQTLQKMLEQKNKAMDAFYAGEAEQFRKALRGK